MPPPSSVDAASGTATAPGRRRSSRPAGLITLVALLLVGAALRFGGLDWDAGQHLHPDERFLTSLAVDLHFPASVSGYFDTAHSSLNPANVGREFFIYGTLPLFLTKAIASLLELGDYGHVHLVGRALAALADLGTVLFTFLIGRRLANHRAALAAAALVTFSVLNIQQAHFFTVDSFATCGVAGMLLGLVRIVRDRRWTDHLCFGIAFGLTLACRPNLLILGPFYAVALGAVWSGGHTPLRRLLGQALLAVAATTVLFRVFQPYAFTSGFWTLSLAPAFLRSFREVSLYASGTADYPPSVQWIGRTPLLFPGGNLLTWGIGPAWGIATLPAIVLVARRAWSDPDRPRRHALWLLLATAVSLFVFHGVQFSATLRYFEPIVPVLALALALWLCGVTTRVRAARVALGTAITLTAFWAVAFTSIYRQPHTRIAASTWLFDHLPPGSTIANEHWDDGLPLNLPGRRDDFVHRELTLYDEENESKRQQLIEVLVASDAVVISSNRLYGSIPRAPWRYPLARRYYELLFSDALGFRLTRAFTSYPTIAGATIRDDDAEEAFTVHDHPAVFVFQKTPAFDRAEVERLLGSVSFAGVVRVPPREASALYRRTRPPDIAPPVGLARAAAPARADAGVDGEEGPGSVWSVLRWLLALEVLSLACFALTTGLMPGARDRGFAVSKVLAWLGPGTLVWLLVTSGLASAGASTARTVAAGLLGAGAAAGWAKRERLRQVWRDAGPVLCAIEATWLAALGLFALIRAANPAIFWGEKPMDFAILNALLRSAHWPPPDPWFAGEALNYSYFGHALAASFAQATGTPSSIAFNLTLATLAGLLATATFGVVFQVTGRLMVSAGAVALMTVAGNLAGLRALVHGLPSRLGFDYFWSTSRVVPGTVNEFPFWNLTFGDLHAHVMAMPLEVTLLFAGSLWATRAASRLRERLWLALLSAWLFGAIAVTSTWSAPAAAAVLAALMLTGGVAGGQRPVAGMARAVAWGVGIAVLAVLVFLPFWSGYEFPPRRAGRMLTEAATLTEVLTFFGTFALVLGPATFVIGLDRVRSARWRAGGAVLLATSAGALGLWRSPACGAFAAVLVLGVLLWHTGRSPATRIAAVLVGAAGVLGVVTETVYVWDRMNTVFKYYLQMWMLLAPATAILAAEALATGRRAARPVVLAAVAAAIAGGTFTSVTGLVGFIREPHAVTPTFTLDGTAYLPAVNGGEAQALGWLNREVRGIPVVLEAQGPFYGPFSRVSMNTGLPTILGWEYHLSQQGRSPEEIAGRAGIVRELFETTDDARTARLLAQYHVDIVYVGPLERATYPRAGLEKFARSRGLQTVFRNRDVTIYATAGQALSAKTWIDSVPPARPLLPAAAPLREPRGLALAPDGSLVIADFGNGRVQRVSAGLTPMAAYGQRGEAPGEFRDPCDIAVRPDGTLLVADTWNHRVQVLTASGDPQTEWRADLFGPRGIALAPDGDALVTDTGHHRVVRFTPDGKPREFVAPGQLDNPVGIAVDAEGLVYVADTGHRRIAVFAPDGQLAREWPVDAWAVGSRLEPALALTSDGLLWVTDPTGGRVLLYERTGRMIGQAASRPVVDVPLGVEAAPDGSALITDGNRPRPIVVQRPANAPAFRLQTPTRKSPER